MAWRLKEVIKFNKCSMKTKFCLKTSYLYKNVLETGINLIIAITWILNVPKGLCIKSSKPWMVLWSGSGTYYKKGPFQRFISLYV